MRIRLTWTLDVNLERQDSQDAQEHHDETALGSTAEHANEHTGPSMGFRVPDAEPEWADKSQRRQGESR